MKNLYELVKGKNCFVVTSNTDSHFTLVGFPKERLFELEGNKNMMDLLPRINELAKKKLSRY